jgi:hypothetical protein
MTAAGTDVGQARVEVSNAAIYSKLLELEAMLAPLLPLIPHIPAALALLDNPATRWKARRRHDV